jgi:hypothetical protein
MIDEYGFVLCSLQADTSTAHSVQMDLLQSAQNTRRGSLGWEEQAPLGGGKGGGGLLLWNVLSLLLLLLLLLDVLEHWHGQPVRLQPLYQLLPAKHLVGVYEVGQRSVRST